MDDITLNEKIHWDTILTKTKDLNKNITLYHVSDVKDPGNKVYPLHLTVGNKLEHSPYYASWWAEESEPGGAIMVTLKIFVKKNYPKGTSIRDYFLHGYVENGKTLNYIRKTWLDENYDKLKKMFGTWYRYIKTFKVKDLGRGQEYGCHEWTYDKEVVADKVENITFEEELRSFIPLSDEEFDKKKSVISDKYMKNTIGLSYDMIKKPWIYHSKDTLDKLQNSLYGSKFSKDEINPKYKYLLEDSSLININDTQVKSLTERVEQIINNKFMDNLLESVDSVKTKQYSEYLITHISNVKKGYFWIKENCPEMLNKCNQKILENNIIAHDESKYSNEEYIPYMNFFYGEKTEAVKKAFNEAWEHHYLNNKHHPEWWHGTPMSEEAILEMICDWWSFSWKSGKLDEIFNYFKDNVENKSKNIHPETKQRVSELLDILHEALIRENLL